MQGTGQDASVCDGFVVLWDRHTSKERRAQGRWNSGGGALPLPGERAGTSGSSRVPGRGLEAAVDYLRSLVGGLISLSDIDYLG